MKAHRLASIGLFLAPRSANASSRTERGDSAAEIIACLKAGIDGFFTDDPAIGREAVRVFTNK